MAIKSAFGKFGLRLIGFTLIVAVIFALSAVIAAAGPSRNLYADDAWQNVSYTAPGYNSSTHNIVLDQHSHTLYSDGKLTIKQNIEWHLAMGFNCIVITDHNTMANKEEIAAAKLEYAGRAIIIQGMEWTTGRIHMNFLGLTDWDFKEFPIPANPSNADIQRAITEAKRQGAVVTTNHFPWSLNQAKMTTHPSRVQMRDWGTDFIEIVNDDSHYDNMYDDESVQFCLDNGIGMITGTDMHRPDQLEAGAVHGWTILNASEFTEDAVMVELRARRTEIIVNYAGYRDQGTYEENPLYMAVFPLAELGSIFVNIFSRGLRADEIVIFAAYTYLIFAGMEITRFMKDRIRKNKTGL
jgi:predicted metal-dependent phosphoesterase TrpH